MHSYELSERGKIVIAVLIMLLLFMLSIILMIKAFANQSALPADIQEPAPGTAALGTPLPAPVEPPPAISGNPPQNSIDIRSPDISPQANSSATVEEAPPNVQDHTTLPSSGPTGGNPSAGTLSFLFSPDYQNALDSETMSLLVDLLSSPSSSLNSTIAVETSMLPDNYTQKLMTAVISAFSEHEIPEQRITHVPQPSETAGETIEVNLYFMVSSVK